MSSKPRSHVDPCSQGVIDAEPCPDEFGRTGPVAQRRFVLAACVLASSMVFIDGSALTVALPALRDDLNASFSAVQWVLNSYILALAAFVLIGGALADAYGRSRILIIGCALFAGASILCAVADNAPFLIVARFFQGLAAALVAPASLALIGAVYPKSMRSGAIGVWAAASALTTSASPVLGGWLTETFGWPSIFWMNPPLTALAVGLLVAAAARDYPAPKPFDIPGAVILALALGCVAWFLSALAPSEIEGARAAPAAPGASVFAAGAAGIVLLVAFVIWEGRSNHPMAPPRLYANKAFAGLNLSTLAIYAGLSIVLFLLPFELIDRRGVSPITAGLAFLPFTLSVGVLSSVFGRLADRAGPRLPLVAGPLTAGAAYAFMIAAREGSFLFGVLAPMALLGVAFALIVAPLTAAVLSSVGEADQGLASGVNNAASRIAQLVGVALAAGLASFEVGYALALSIAAFLSLAAAVFAVRTVPRRAGAAD